MTQDENKKLDKIQEKLDDVVDTQNHIIHRLEKAEQVTDIFIKIAQSVSEKVVNMIGWAVIISFCAVLGWLVNFFGGMKAILQGFQ